MLHRFTASDNTSMAAHRTAFCFQGPQGKNGIPGRDGKDGMPGRDGEQSAITTELSLVVKKCLLYHLIRF